MSMTRILLPCLLAFAPGLLPAGVPTGFKVGGRGTFHITLPASWKEGTHQTPPDLPPTFVFERTQAPRAKFLVSVLWSPRNDPAFGTEESLRAMIQAGRDQYGAGAVEKELPSLALKGAQGPGSYFQATDRDYRPSGNPEDFPVVSYGSLGSTKVVFVFSLLSMAKEDPAVREALGAIAAATFVPETAVPPVAGKAQTVKVPGLGWAIGFTAPALMDPQDRTSDSGYAYRAHADRFNLSLFVEPPANAATGHRACYDHYWPQASRNPAIDKATVQVTETSRHVRVAYDVKATFQGRPLTLRNVNYYMAHQGRWIDVHISIVEPVPEDESVFRAFDQSLECGPVR